jgi:hypothetical protein
MLHPDPVSPLTPVFIANRQKLAGILFGRCMNCQMQDTPPTFSTQMPWWEAGGWLFLLPLSIWLFRMFATQALPGFMTVSAQGRTGYLVLKAGLIVSTLILLLGTMGSGKALSGLLNYVTCDGERIVVRRFNQPQKQQKWAELIGASFALDRISIDFLEGGRWRTTLIVHRDQLGDAPFEVLMAWLYVRAKNRDWKWDRPFDEAMREIILKRLPEAAPRKGDMLSPQG